MNKKTSRHWKAIVQRSALRWRHTSVSTIHLHVWNKPTLARPLNGSTVVNVPAFSVSLPLVYINFMTKRSDGGWNEIPKRLGDTTIMILLLSEMCEQKPPSHTHFMGLRWLNPPPPPPPPPPLDKIDDSFRCIFVNKFFHIFTEVCS